MAVKYDCVSCHKQVTATKNSRYRSHTGGDGESCEMSSEQIPEHILAQPVGEDDRPDVPREGVDFAVCGDCGRSVKLTRLGYYEHHETTLRGGVRCVMSGVRYRTEVKVENELLTEPGTSEMPKVRDSSTPTTNRGICASSAAATGAAKGGASGAPETGSATPGAPASPATTAISRGGAPTPFAAGTSDRGEPSPGETSAKPSLEEPGKGNLERQPMSSPESTSTPRISTTPSGSAPKKPSVTPSGAGGETAGSASAGGVPQALHLAPLLGDGSVLQPFSHIFQPFPVPQRVSLKQAMSEGGKERATRFREIFYSYGNRRTSDNRSAQTTLGPSEIGHECDRRLAMSLMGVEPVNPGGDGWAAWVGTQGHKGLDEVFSWASANTGRFATEVQLTFPSRLVPKGTTDLIDRMHGDIGDFKFMGEYSLKKLIAQGPPEHYRVQAHTYGLGATLAGEKIRNVVIYGLPRGGASLDGMYVWTEPYSEKVARDALARVDRIAEEAARLQGPGTPRDPLVVAKSFDVTPECKFCPFYLKGDLEGRRGCPGK